MKPLQYNVIYEEVLDEVHCQKGGYFCNYIYLSDVCVLILKIIGRCSSPFLALFLNHLFSYFYFASFNFPPPLLFALLFFLPFW